MLTEKIYKRDSLGKIRFWQAGIEGRQWRVMTGIEGEPSSWVTSGWTFCTGKQKRTHQEQAVAEATAEMQKKLAREYRATIEDVDTKISAWVKPMLAHKYETWQGPCFAQPKLDGIRCIATSSGLFSREGKPIVAVPHVQEALKGFFDLYPVAALDGELYNHDYHDDFNSIVSAVKRTRPSEQDLALSARLVQYHIYDIPTLKFTFRHRSEFLAREIERSDRVLQVVDTWRCENEKELDRAYEFFLESDYEGQMVRLDGPYEHKRSKLLLKRKEFLDDEFDVVEVLPGNGNWAGIAKKAVLLLPDGRQFGAGLRGTVEQMKALQAGPKPATATVRYFALTPDGVPRFPVVTAFHSGDRL